MSQFGTDCDSGAAPRTMENWYEHREMIEINIVVCIKQVPGTTEIKIDPQTNTLIREGIESIINPFDTYAVEEAVRIKERIAQQSKEGFSGPESKVIAITMGPPQAENILREAISVGVDIGVLLSDRALAGADTLATSFTLAKAIRKLEREFGKISLILCGRQTLDGDTGQVGPELAQQLNLPCLGYVIEVMEIDNKYFKLKRLMEDRYEVFRVPLPAVISVSKGINEPRVPSLRGAMRAKSAPITVWRVSDLDVKSEEVGLSGSATQVIKVFSPHIERQSEIFTGDVDTQVEKLTQKLQSLGVV
ncbi:electron transfer flavoprotein beta subunit [Candidatus Hakubella thermalkaliphila]|uniref:Electron transfer flavoprotein small subunit n=1 Tax=Candidatus Hakubella thermalkaliphila TaxID=2754717 RepID=A0A6V8PNE1_9ACTN|nr:electron transfer flavoprotein beta subunit [Candidatus Hakubella thermalkaliphila]GFP32401.1 electron transfer flavoprotein beta subunit [Candidatus Hakubella thermalkaliphila]GFP37135.1 electron transfer flavoprotein beta subunit [Candidatus Hakubella thermalkaliphila]GFP41789.1 electron transfer flavoprotein beta subunit [Candidatus Hakubella thermalkaliphila]